jgi:hypothetical protein
MQNTPTTLQTIPFILIKYTLNYKMILKIDYDC